MLSPKAGNRRGMVGASVHLAVRTPTTRDLEWAAGFMEGEGTFTRSSNKGSVRVSAVQVNPEPLGKLLEIFGGRCKRRLPMASGKQAYWDWWTTGSRARGIMLTLYPLLSAKRQDEIRDSVCA